MSAAGIETGFATPQRQRPGRRLLGWLHLHQTALLVIVVAFVGRLLLAPVNSYWLDEIYSVYVHGTTPGSTAEVIESMWGIIHPPLYQLVLFHWIGIFGDSEVATRSLSNLFIALASLFLYLFARQSWGKGVALASLIVFSMMAIPLQYALETRSYAMVIMWATASSWAMGRFLDTPAVLRPWRSFLMDRYALLLVAMNTAAIFTHYYAAFFVAAQGAFMVAWLSMRHGVWKKPAALARLAVVGSVPPALLLGLWGGSMVERYRKGGRFASGDESPGFLEAFSESVLEPNIVLTNPVVVVLLLFAAVYLVRGAAGALRGRSPTFAADMACYTAFWLIGSFCVAFIVLRLVGQDAYGTRYFAFTAPALSLLLVIGAFELLRLGGFVSKRGPVERIHVLSGLFGVLIATLTVLPQGYSAATASKHDWRFIAHLVARTVTADSRHSYIVYDTGWRQRIFNYYLAKQPGDVEVDRTITVNQNRRKVFPTRADRRRISEHDYVVVVFTHLPYYRYRDTLRRLGNSYQEAYRVLSADGRGYIVYRVND